MKPVSILLARLFSFGSNTYEVFVRKSCSPLTPFSLGIPVIVPRSMHPCRFHLLLPSRSSSIPDDLSPSLQIQLSRFSVLDFLSYRSKIGVVIAEVK
jgi:hypothetical protein